MTVATLSGEVYADTWPGWGWGPSDVPNEMAFVVTEASQQLVFTADEKTGSPRMTYEIKKTDTPTGVMRTGSVPT